MKSLIEATLMKLIFLLQLTEIQYNSYFLIMVSPDKSELEFISF